MISTRRRLQLTGAVLLFAVSGCTGESPSQSVEPGPSSTPNAPSPSASVDPGVAGDPLFQVRVDGLRMRSEASTSAEIVRTLEKGEVVRVVSGPVEADGYQWFEVLDLDSLSGWVAAGEDGTAWLDSVPADPTTSELLIRFQRDGDVSPRTMSEETVFPPDVTVTADGRVVLGWNGVVRQLSPSGLARVEQEVLTLPALQESAEIGRAHV